MKFLYITLLTVFFVGCQQKDLKVPVNDQPGLHEVWNNSPVYILLKKNGNDTLADLKLGQTISTTKWLVAVDKRLKLKHLLPALKKVIRKRRKKSMHSDGKGQMYFTYLDSLQNKISFVEFTHLDIMPDYFQSKSYFDEYPKAEMNTEKWHVVLTPNFYRINDSIVLPLNSSLKQLGQKLAELDNQKVKGEKRQIYLNFDHRLSFDHFLNTFVYFKNHPLKNSQISSKIFIFTPNKS